MESFVILGTSDWGVLIFLLLLLGGMAGFSAGLLGVGGGIILVPGLYYLFDYLGFPFENLMHIAVGTSLGVIVPTGLSSAMAHWKRGSVGLDLVRKIGVGLVAGVVCGALVAGQIDGHFLQTFFASMMVMVAGVMVFDPARLKLFNGLPPQPFSGMIGGIVGLISTLVGIGGASFNVPFMRVCGVSMHRAIGSASALGVLITIPASIGFMVIGWDVDGRPPFSFGYINAPAWIVIVSSSVLMAPVGAWAAHKLPADPLRKIFAVYIILVAIKMWFDIFGGGS